MGKRNRTAVAMSEFVVTMNYLYMLQITEKLLEAEEKKLQVLKAEIEAGRRTDASKDTSKVKTL